MATGRLLLQSSEAIASLGVVNDMEAHVLRLLDEIATDHWVRVDPRSLAVGRTSIEQGFMAIGRAVRKAIGAELETAWVVERSDNDDPVYFAPAMHGAQWTDVPDQALRFARREDAVSMAAALAIECRAVECSWGTP